MKNEKYWIEKKCLICDNKFWSLIKRNQKTCSLKCNGIYVAKNPNRINKIKQTKLKKYGNETYVNPEKAKQTCLEKYGVNNSSKSEIIKNKIIETNRKKYGVDFTWQNEEIKEKIRKINLNKFGVENPSSSQEVKDKRKNTFIQRYGVSNPFQLSDVKSKSISTNLIKYSYEYWSQNPEMNKKSHYKRRITIYNKNKKKLESLVNFLFDESNFKGIDKQYLYDFKCNKCGNIFKDHMDGNGHPRCLVCYPNIQETSLYEMEIYNFIKSILNSNEIIENKNRKILNGLELDIYIPSLKLAIEFNGIFWHSEFFGGKNKYYHLNKTNECEKNGIRLIHIFEDEWVNKKEIVKEKLKHIFKLNTTDKIFARKCVIKEVSYIEGNKFLNKTHIQGGCNSSLKIGLYFNDHLVSIMTFGNLRLALGNSIKNKNYYELLRYSTSKNVIGGFSKLLNYFIKNYNPLKIISYADRRWSIGNLYKINGFELIDNGKPNYWYFKPGHSVRYHRFGFRKNVLSKKISIFDQNLTEWENMKLNGWDRIWDCGNLKYEIKNIILP